MARRKVVNGVEIEFTFAEEADRDAEEAVWANRRIPTDDEIDQEELNRALIMEGSIVRAIVEVMFIEVNKLRIKDGDSEYTRLQFVNALKSKMRNSV